MRFGPRLDQNPVTRAESPTKKKASRIREAFFLYENAFLSARYYGRTPQPAPGYVWAASVGAAVGFESQYILDVNSSGPCRATAASRFAEFTECSLVEY